MFSYLLEHGIGQHMSKEVDMKIANEPRVKKTEEEWDEFITAHFPELEDEITVITNNLTGRYMDAAYREGLKDGYKLHLELAGLLKEDAGE